MRTGTCSNNQHLQKNPGKERDERIIVFEQVDIDQVRLVYATPQQTEPLDIRVEHLDQHHRVDDFLDLKLEATIGDRHVWLESETGTWSALLSGKEVHFDLDARLDTFVLSGKGMIDDILNPLRPSLSFTASGPDIDDLTRLLNMGEHGSGDINLSGSLRPVQQGSLVLDIEGNVGRTEIEVRGAFSDLQDLEDIDIDILASGPDIRPIFALIGIDQVRESPFMFDIDAQRKGSTFIVQKADVPLW